MFHKISLRLINSIDYTLFHFNNVYDHPLQVFIIKFVMAQQTATHVNTSGGIIITSEQNAQKPEALVLLLASSVIITSQYNWKYVKYVYLI